MNKNGKRKLRIGGVFTAAFIAWTVLLRTVDVQPKGPNGSKIGFAALNGWFHNLTSVNATLYTLTDWLGLVPMLICMIFAAVGAVQMCRRRSLFKVDSDLLILGCYYIVTILCYLIFETIPINCRPVLMNGVLEASYPSSTTLLVLCVMPALAEQLRRRIRNRSARRVLILFDMGFTLFMVLGRTISGVHWLTDIVGAILLSAGLFYTYRALVDLYCCN